MLNQRPTPAARGGHRKVLMHPDRGRVELYDTPADPGEMTGRAGKNPAAVGRLARHVPGCRAAPPNGPAEPAAGKNDYPWPKELK